MIDGSSITHVGYSLLSGLSLLPTVSHERPCGGYRSEVEVKGTLLGVSGGPNTCFVARTHHLAAASSSIHSTVHTLREISNFRKLSNDFKLVSDGKCKCTHGRSCVTQGGRVNHYCDVIR